MRKGAWVALLAAFVAATATAGEEHFDVKQELASTYLRDWLGTDVSLYLAEAPTPEFAEVGRTETYLGWSLSPSPFGGGRRHCLDAFRKAMKSIVDAAVAHGYDAVVNIRAIPESGPSKDPASFKCTPGYKVTSVSVSGSLAMSVAAKQRQVDAELRSLNVPDRKPADGAIFLPVGPILESTETKQIFSDGLSLHWGPQAPPYNFQYGPDDYADQAELTSAGPEAACNAAVLNVLRQIADEARTRMYDSIIKVRSHLDGEYAPAHGDVECLVSKKKVSVTVQATLAQRK